MTCVSLKTHEENLNFGFRFAYAVMAEEWQTEAPSSCYMAVLRL